MVEFNVKAIDSRTKQLIDVNTNPVVTTVTPGLSGTVRKTNPANFFASESGHAEGWLGDVTVIAAGYAPWTTGADPQVHFKDTSVEVLAELTPSFKRPSVDAVRRFRGNFCGLVLPYLTYGPDQPGGKLLFTPAVVCESRDIRKRVFDDYLAAGGTHFPLNLHNHSTIYHDIYPQWDEHIINEVLIDALRAGLIPGGCFMGDDDDTLNCVADPGLVSWGFPKWEQNGPDPFTQDINAHFLECKIQYPNTQMYFHFTARHSAGGQPEGDWWSWAWEHGCRGILYQHDLWNFTPQQVAERCSDFLVRFNDPNHYLGWPKGPDFVSFEMTAYPVFWKDITLAVGNQMNRELWKLLEQLPYKANGYCNG